MDRAWVTAAGTMAARPMRRLAMPLVAMVLVAMAMAVVVVGVAIAEVGTAAADVSPPIVDIELTPDQQGYWVLDGAGAVAYVNAPFHGDRPALAAGESVVSMTGTTDGGGYWLFTNRGRVVTYGNAGRFGDMSGVTLNGPVIDSVATPSGDGYYMVASDGGIFSFGDATFYGSMGGIPLNGPVNGLAPTASGDGYWLVADDGGIFSFGDARFYGSMGGARLNQPVIGMVGQGNGYLMVAADGGIFTFGASRFHGSLGGVPLRSPITAVTVRDDLSGYAMVSTAGSLHEFGSMPDTGWRGFPEPGVGFALPTRRMAVGVDIQPGTYRIHPRGTGVCDWNKLGATGAGYAGGFSSSGPMVATISAADGHVGLGWNCWLAVSDLSALRADPTAPLVSGSYIVHRDIRPGTWRTTTATGSCTARTRNGFDGTLATVNSTHGGLGVGPWSLTVVIASTDVGFDASDGCGTWHRIG